MASGNCGYTFGILTLSDKGSRGEREDTSGKMLCDLLVSEGYVLLEYDLIPDQMDQITASLTDWADNKSIDLILTTGGTGVAPSDVTPEATRMVIDKEVPGIAEAMRAASLAITVNAVLSRGIAGIRGKSLIINLPGSKKAAQENIGVVLPALQHALYKLKGGPDDCAAPDSSVS